MVTVTAAGMIDNEVVTRIAKKIRATRLEKKLTIQQLANRTRVSKGLLSKIENMRTVPSLPVFVTLIQSLDVSFKDFFKDLVDSEGKDYRLVKRDEYFNSPEAETNGISHHHIMLQRIPESTLEAAIVSMEAGKRGKVSTEKSFVLIYMLSGLCVFEIGNEGVSVDKGDVVSFDSSIPHSIRSEQSCSFLQLLVSPTR